MSDWVDAAASHFVAELVVLLSQAIEKHQGRVVKLLGDGLFVVFVGESETLAASMQIHLQTIYRSSTAGNKFIPLPW